MTLKCLWACAWHIIALRNRGMKLLIEWSFGGRMLGNWVSRKHRDWFILCTIHFNSIFINLFQYIIFASPKPVSPELYLRTTVHRYAHLIRGIPKINISKLQMKDHTANRFPAAKFIIYHYELIDFSDKRYVRSFSYTLYTHINSWFVYAHLVTCKR